jgi:hypothetical protein
VSWLEVLAVIAIIGFVIYQQLAGQLLQGRHRVADGRYVGAILIP